MEQSLMDKLTILADSAKYDVACCLMHNKSNTEYQNFLIDMLANAF